MALHSAEGAGALISLPLLIPAGSFGIAAVGKFFAEATVRRALFGGLCVGGACGAADLMTFTGDRICGAFHSHERSLFREKYGFTPDDLQRDGAESLKFWWLESGDNVLTFALKVNNGTASTTTSYQKQKRLLKTLLDKWPGTSKDKYAALQCQITRAARHMNEHPHTSETFAAARDILRDL